jgi:hypothetical protein
MKGLPLSDTDRRLTRFLLGGLPDAERREIELAFLEHDDTFADLVALEDELRFAYLENALDPEDRARFEARYLATPEDREKLAMARTLLDRVAAEGTRIAQPAAVPAWWRRPSVQFALAAATLVLAVASAWLFTELRRVRRDVESMRAEIAARTPADEVARLRNELGAERRLREALEQQARGKEPPPPFEAVLALVLTPGLSRSSGADVPRVSLGAVTGSLRLELTLPKDAAFPTYAATLLDADGRQLLATRNLRASNATVGTIVPRRLLARADYEVVLHGVDAAGRSESLANYYFRVSR